MKIKNKAGKSFIMLLAVMSMLSLFVSSLHYFGIIDLTAKISGVLSTLLGLALIIEAGGLTVIKMFQGGISGAEVVHITTAFLGLFVLVGGVMSLLNMTVAGTAIGGIVGLANGIAGVFVLVQAFVV